MNYGEALDFIHNTRWLGSKLGLRRVGMLLERMGNPQKKLKFIHVAGTNGKGSTCSMISRILLEEGYRTGLYISPFVIGFNERIQLNNEMIPDGELVKSVEAVKPHWEALDSIGETPTEFEVVTAVAMDYFARMKCDAVVLEVGLGGRLDSTNIIDTPLCSVITNIGLEHTKYLGDTLSDIAFEKCGIIKQNGITVCSQGQEPEAMEVVEKTCRELGNLLIVPKKAEVLSSDIFGSDIRYGGIELHVPLAGMHQVSNAVTAIEAVKAAKRSGFDVSDLSIASGIAKTSFPARFEILSENPLIILDGAHNPDGAKKLSKTLKLLGGRKIHAVFCVMGDKDADGILKEVLPHCATAAAAITGLPNALEVSAAALKAKKYCDCVYTAKTLDEAILGAIDRAKDDGVVLFFGSLYFAGLARPAVYALIGRPDPQP